uniref:Uncharacterized protein n=1 Tax=Rhizophora mucronata TaxID=61149 RepID=A0A2P2LQT0_RHIMU
MTFESSKTTNQITNFIEIQLKHYSRGSIQIPSTHEK